MRACLGRKWIVAMAQRDATERVPLFPRWMCGHAREAPRSIHVEGHALRLVRLSPRIARLLVGSLDAAGRERLVEAAYPDFRMAAQQAGHRDARRVLRRFARWRPGIIEDLACEALHVAGVPVEMKGVAEFEAAQAQLAELDAVCGPISLRGELARLATPLAHPGLQFTRPSSLWRSMCCVPRPALVRRRARAGRPGHARRVRKSARAPDDPGEPEPGETARRVAEDDVAVRRLLSGAVA
jgi:hypothetical protein